MSREVATSISGKVVSTRCRSKHEFVCPSLSVSREVASGRDKLLNPDIWPCNIFVRKFRRPRQQNGTFRQTDSR